VALADKPRLGAVGGNSVDEGVLEADHVWPDERRNRRGDALAHHPTSPVDDLRHTDEHLLRVTTPQIAGATERIGIDDGDTPTRLPGGIGDAARCVAGAYDNQVNSHRPDV
jgi:hypothetical protein